MFRRAGILSVLALTTFLCCGATSPDGCQSNNQNFNIGPSKGEVIGVGVAAVAVIALGTFTIVEVHASHHRVKGCVFAGPNGLELQTSDKHVYALSGDVLKVKEGEMVQVHGNKIKRTKDSTGDQTFVVEKLNKSYGSCTLASATGTAPVKP